MKLPPDQLLIRWVNYQLDEAGHPEKHIKNFTGDIKVVPLEFVFSLHWKPTFLTRVILTFCGSKSYKKFKLYECFRSFKRSKTLVKFLSEK